LKVDFLEPTGLPEATALLAEHGAQAKIIAGGTSVVLMLRQRLISPTVLISLGRVPSYDFIHHDADGLHLGALTSLRDAERSQVVYRFCPALAHTFHLVGNIRVRHQATVGGNLAAADYAADPPAMLMALDARLKIVGPETTREVPLREFFLGFYQTVLDPAEIVAEVIIPPLPDSARAAYFKYTSASAEGRPCVAVGAAADFDSNGRCRDLRIAVGAAVETPQRLAEVEALAHGQALTGELVAAIAEGYSRTLDPLSDVRGSAWYRRQMIRVFVQRALEEVRDGHR
jgi:carbon-monoxide dehydrogenase medium subunit